MKLVDSLIPSVTTFIETGTAAGTTLAHVARLYPWLSCFSCEADPRVADIARENLKNHNQRKAHIHTGKSLDFLEMVTNQFKLNEQPALFWLDAHSHGYGCPVRGEVEFILSHWKSGYILIDDFKNPHNNKWKFDTYDDGVLGIERLHGMARPVFYPNYDPTFGSRGWCLVPIGSMNKPTCIPMVP